MLESQGNLHRMRFSEARLRKNEDDPLELIASLDGPAEQDVEEAWLAEAERRQREAADKPEALEDWDDLRARILVRLRASRP